MGRPHRSDTYKGFIYKGENNQYNVVKGKCRAMCLGVNKQMCKTRRGRRKHLVCVRSRTSSPRLSRLEQSVRYTGNAEVWSRERETVDGKTPASYRPAH